MAVHYRQKDPTNVANITITTYGQVRGPGGKMHLSSSWPSLRFSPVLSTRFSEVSGGEVWGRGVKRETRASREGPGP